jgi:hypothetical protein
VVVEDCGLASGVAVGLVQLLGLFCAFLDCGFADAADEALVLFVVLDYLSRVSELCEGIDHNTAHNITEQQLHNHHIDEIREIPSEPQILVLRTNNPRRVKTHNTVLEHLALLLLGLVDEGQVQVELDRDHIEDVDEHED